MSRDGAAVNLPYSALVLLFGDLFVGLGGDWELPWRGAHVEGRALARAALSAALVSMARAHHIYLSTALRKGLLRETEAVLVEKGPKTPSGSQEGLEGLLWAKLSSAEAFWADDLIREVAGGGVPYPDFVILAKIMDYLTDRGYFTRKRLGGLDLRVGGLALSKPGYELEPVIPLICAAEGPAQEARAYLGSFAARNPLLWEKLQKLI